MEILFFVNKRFIFFCKFKYFFVFFGKTFIKRRKAGKNEKKRRIELVRGVHKRIIEVKISGSRLFDHACLVFKSGDIANETSERDILAEANRIISESGAVRKKKRGRVGRTIGVRLLCALFLALGVGLGLAIG